MQRTQQSGWHEAGAQTGAETLRTTGQQEGPEEEGLDASQSGLKGAPGLEDQTGACAPQPCKAFRLHLGQDALTRCVILGRLLNLSEPLHADL